MHHHLLYRSLCACIFLFSRAILGAAAAAQIPLSLAAATGSLDAWLAIETPFALNGIFENTGDGSRQDGVDEGIVIASPSKEDPDYFYTWTRDSALVFKCLVDTFIAASDDDSGDGDESVLQTRIHQYISSQAYLQTVWNPSGGWWNGAGLGEPKFQVNSTPFVGSWGRPQADGPGLRAVTMMAYARWLIANGYESTAERIVWPVIQNDLSFVAAHWNSSGFADLWEEVQGLSFFTTLVQHRALVEGRDLAVELGLECAYCESQAPQVRCLLQTYWTGSYMDSHPGSGRAGKDASTILASIYGFDPDGGCDDITFQPCSARALANHKAVTDSFRLIYPINAGLQAGKSVAIGRYAEDVYHGGHPWYLTTFAAAEQLYDAIYQWHNRGSIDISDVSLGFFKDIYSRAAVGTYAASGETFWAIVAAVREYADGYLSVAQKYTPDSGELAEQFSRQNGIPLSANNLTWSYAALLTAAARRRSIVPPSWSEWCSTDVPETCLPTFAIGSYKAASITSWPPALTSKGGSEILPPACIPTTPEPSPTTPCTTPPTSVTVTFNEIATTEWGEVIFIVGSIPQLGSWKPTDAITLSAYRYTGSNHLWYQTINLPSGASFEYKYLRKKRDGAIVWEGGPNRAYTVPKQCGLSRVMRNDDHWR
ncbi:hypothetical protein AJ80_09162 [Polytolypa hystricis UAMH7299]|uniref:Glucoamylase n=1 Tax=Polytolypa hystricis (strain UAMH7299) TaxID=1447883 RepID=A0A2B7WUT0_POLH7|nr:hypothetical protein AJ80_09162 [Polytolypa hystricis UAMH7299]